MEALSGLIVLAVVGAIYFLPTIIAANRQHHNVGAIVVVNLLLGWTFIGWVVALAMASGQVRGPTATPPGTSQALPAGALPLSLPPPPSRDIDRDLDVFCVACGTRIRRLSYACWKCGASTAESVAAAVPPATPEPTERPCPFCESLIPLTAKKCRHCGEWVVPEAERGVL